MLQELKNPIWFDTPKGAALCHFVIYHGMENNLQWVCFTQDHGECWTFDNSEVRAQKNITLGRRVDEGKPELPIFKATAIGNCGKEHASVKEWAECQQCARLSSFKP